MSARPDSPPRFERVAQDSPDPQVQEAYAKARGLFGHVSELFEVLANAPTALSGWIEMLTRLRTELVVGTDLAELAVLTVARLHDNGRVAASHRGQAAAAGVPEAVLDAVPGPLPASAPTELVLACRLAEQVVAGGATEDLVRQCQQVLGVRQTAELVVLCGFYCMVVRVNASLDVYTGPAPVGSDG